jgi:hypothetical protein
MLLLFYVSSSVLLKKALTARVGVCRLGVPSQERKRALGIHHLPLSSVYVAPPSLRCFHLNIAASPGTFWGEKEAASPFKLLFYE